MAAALQAYLDFMNSAAHVVPVVVGEVIKARVR
jgi:hypothetical protein